MCWEWWDGGWGTWPGCFRHRLGPTGTKTLEVKEWYQNREDMLELKHINKITGLNVDYFKPGHPQALRSAWTPSLGQLGAQGGGLMSSLEQPAGQLMRGGRNQHPYCQGSWVESNRNSPCLPKQSRCVGGQRRHRKSKEM